MCLYPRLMINRKYTPTAKNNYQPPKLTDARVKYVPVGCGKCMECRKQKARSWQARLTEDIRHNTNGKFITLTFSNESLEELTCKIAEENDGEIPLNEYDLNNAIATKAVRLFTERYRKQHGKTIRHWLITEMGHNGTERIHLHGIIWTDEPLDKIEKLWKYGFMWKGKGEKKQNYVNEATVNYIVKYVTKIDEKHKKFEGKILCSKGIGRDYTKRPDYGRNEYNEKGETRETYILRNGQKINLPIYWRNKRYTEKQREKLWIQKIDKGIRYICGVKLVNATPERINQVLRAQQERNEQLGYGKLDDWTEEQYSEELNIIIKNKPTIKIRRNRST